MISAKEAYGRYQLATTEAVWLNAGLHAHYRVGLTAGSTAWTNFTDTAVELICEILQHTEEVKPSDDVRETWQRIKPWDDCREQLMRALAAYFEQFPTNLGDLLLDEVLSERQEIWERVLGSDEVDWNLKDPRSAKEILIELSPETDWEGLQSADN